LHSHYLISPQASTLENTSLIDHLGDPTEEYTPAYKDYEIHNSDKKNDEGKPCEYLRKQIHAICIANTSQSTDKRDHSIAVGIVKRRGKEETRDS
jgi:hypothetical protein